MHPIGSDFADEKRLDFEKALKGNQDQFWAAPNLRFDSENSVAAAAAAAAADLAAELAVELAVAAARFVLADGCATEAAAVASVDVLDAVAGGLVAVVAISETAQPLGSAAGKTE